MTQLDVKKIPWLLEGHHPNPFKPVGNSLFVPSNIGLAAVMNFEGFIGDEACGVIVSDHYYHWCRLGDDEKALDTTEFVDQVIRPQVNAVFASVHQHAMRLVVRARNTDCGTIVVAAPKVEFGTVGKVLLIDGVPFTWTLGKNDDGDDISMVETFVGTKLFG